MRTFRLPAGLSAILWSAGAAAAQTVSVTLTTPTTTYLTGGGTVTLTAGISYSVQPTALGGSIFIPAGWTLASTGGPDVPGSTPKSGTTDQLDYAYFAFPTGSAQFAIVLNYPAGLTGAQTITSSFQYRSPTQNIVPAAIVISPGAVTPALSASQAVPSKTLTATTAFTAFTPVTAANGTPPYRFAVSPALPAGLVLNATTGAVGGTSAEASAAAIYTVTITDGKNATASATFSLLVNPVLATTTKVSGAGSIVGIDIPHPNGNFYDQVLLTGASAAITAEAHKVTRMSFIDLNDDIVQVEFSGAGTLALSLENASGPAAPVNYNQPDVLYMKGHASLVISGADETSNVSVFSVGRLTAFDPTGGFNFILPVSAANNPANNGSPLFQGHASTAYDGVADIGLISIASANGSFGGIHTADAACFRASGQTGVSAPGVTVTGPVVIGDITADADATPVLVFGSAPEVKIAGGDLLQLNNRPVQVDGIARVTFADGTKSSGQTLPAQTNRGRLEKNGVDVTSQLVSP